MPTPTTRLRAVLQDPGSNLNTWGSNLNDQALALLDEAIAGVERITLSGDLTLSSANYLSDQARNAALIFGGSPASPPTVTIPAVEKTYVVVNLTGQTLTMTAGGVGAVIPAADRAVVWCDGTDCGLATYTAAQINGLIASASLSASLPGQSGQAGKYLGTDGSIATWNALPLQTLPPLNLSGAYTVVGADRAKWIEVTAGTFTLSFEAPNVLTAGWFAWVRNGGTGNVTIPASDGVTNWIMYPGETRLFRSDGTTLRSVVVFPLSVTLTASVSWVKPPGYTTFSVECLGAGGGGGSGAVAASGATRAGGGGGGGGSYASATIAASGLGATVSVTVGAGGAGGSGSAVAGSVGGTTSFGTALVAYGGAGAVVTSSQGGGGAGVSGAGSGGTGGAPLVSGSAAELFGGGAGGSSGGGTSGSSIYGGAGGGGGAISNPATIGASSTYGGTGGSGGGGISSANAVLAAAAANVAGETLRGLGAAGGAAVLAGAGAAGGAGGLGCGGGGGGGATTGNASGAGGAGGSGAIRIRGQA
jgi:hypothetical protein